MKMIYPLALGLTAAFLTTGCGSASGADAGAIAAAQRRKAGVEAPPSEADSDRRIESSFRTSYVYITHLREGPIEIVAEKGKVTLSGTAACAGRKLMAAHVAGTLAGVKSVDNRIEVAGAAIADGSDAAIRARVETELVFHRKANARKTVVAVEHGCVTLRGEAASKQQKESTAECARSIRGVKDVKNEMTVAARPWQTKSSINEFIDDASISAQVRASLLAHQSTGALRPKVETKDGTVTLSGEARSRHEKELVSELVADLKGVKKVANNMATEMSVSSGE